MRLFGLLFIVVGFLLIAAAAGSQDFYEECRAAADCVAGDPPSVLVDLAQTLGGAMMIMLGYQLAKSE